MRIKYFIFLFVMSLKIYSQQINKDSSNFWEKITVRKSFESKNSNAEPAQITYTKPKNKVDSWLLNAAIGFNILKEKKQNKVLTLSPYFEYHLNTLIEKEQDNWLTGFALELQIRDISANSNKKWTPILISSVKYNNDNIKDITSFQGNYYVTFIARGTGMKARTFWIPNNTVKFGNLTKFLWSPYIGFENENRISTESIEDKGNIYRAYFRINSNFSLFPNNDKIKNKFEINFDWQYRYNLIENVTNLDKISHSYFSTSFNYLFYSSDDEKKSAKIGIDYVNGENPSINFEEQSFYAVTLKFKL